MKYSEIALKVLAAKERNIIKSNAQFWKDFADLDDFERQINIDNHFNVSLEKITNELENSDIEGGIICCYDIDFPIINRKAKNNGDKPYLLFYKGDLSLLRDLNKNVAVIGLIDPDKGIASRESEFVLELVSNQLTIVSGLAMGCDTIAHEVCLANGGTTIAILPSPINKIFPSQNNYLAEQIVEKGGLLVSEYYSDAKSKQEAINRFIERDRLQALFSKAIIMVASYRKGEGDSGSRHAMQAAKRFEIERYVMYNKVTDEQNTRFGLNKEFLEDDSTVKIWDQGTAKHIKLLNNPYLSQTENYINAKQLGIF